jgi:hypothetical protein
MTRFFTFLILLLVSAPLAHAQSFSTSNGRNHPEIEWLTADTEHFRIVYPAHLAGIEAETASVAEETYANLARLLKVEFDYKIPIYLSDQDEIVNGFAVPFDRAYTQIWVRLNESDAFTGQEKWIRKVVAHELAHIFHFRAIQSNVGLLGDIGAFPRQWAEGFAQYSTEKWDAARGDALLRTAIFEDRPSFDRGESLKDGGLTYAVGNSQLRYFSQVYGDSAHAGLFAQRDTLFKRIIYHNFNKAFKRYTGQTYAEFNEDWRKFANIHYNTLAGYMGHLDSLGSKPMELPAVFLSDVRYSPDTSRVAISGFAGEETPFARIWIRETKEKGKTRVVYEGTDAGRVSWSPDGSEIAFARERRGPNGSIINDVYVVDVKSGRSRRVTTDLKAAFPVWSADGSALFASVNENGTGNIHRIDPASGASTRLTEHVGDVQLSNLSHHPSGPWLAFNRFDAEGARQIVVLNTETRALEAFTDPIHDDRALVWSPAGDTVLYTSMRDLVPNVFLAPFADGRIGEETRVTNQFTGFHAFQWLPADSLNPNGRILGRATDTKMSDQAWRIDAGMRTSLRIPTEVSYYSDWTRRDRPDMIPWVIAPDASLIADRGRYQPIREVDHIVSLPFAYYNSTSDWGIGGFTYFREPLGIHEFVVGASIAPMSFEDQTTAIASYINRSFHPTLSVDLYHNLFETRVYSDDLLLNRESGAGVGAMLPLDLFDHPFAETGIMVRSDVVWSRADRASYALPLQDNLSAPQDGTVWLNEFWFTATRVKPNRGAMIHLLDGMGVRAGVRYAGMDADYVQPEAEAYALLPVAGPMRLYLAGRVVKRYGNGLAQDIVGFSRYDEPDLGDYGLISFARSGAERVRGYRQYATGDGLYFGSAELRVPVAPTLNTSVLGLVSLGRTSAAVFADAGRVTGVTNIPGTTTEDRFGVGAELKNELSILGLSISQSIGLARPADRWDDAGANDLYWRIKGVVAF